MIAFGGAKSTKGNTGPFWVGSGLAILSAIVVFFFIRPLSADSMTKEDAEFRRYLEENGFDTSLMGTGEEDSIDSTTVIDSRGEKASLEKDDV